MTHYTMPRIKIMQDNPIRRPTEQAEAKARRIGTVKGIATRMAERMVAQLAEQETQAWQLCAGGTVSQGPHRLQASRGEQAETL